MKQGPRGDISFTFNNIQYTLLPTYKALAEIEKNLNNNLIQIAELLNSQKLNIHQMILILWYSLNKQSLPPGIADNPEEFGEKIINLGIQKIHNLTVKFLLEYFKYEKS